MPAAKRTRLIVGGAVLTAVVAASVGLVLFWPWGMAVPEATELRAAVKSRPSVPVVFTSRSTAASFEAAAPEADGFHYPGTIPWVASEGRLRLLTPEGKVYELTWNRKLPDGGTLVDVMSPTVSLDAKFILFAGRRAAPDPGRWRIYRMDVNGHNYKQVTGGPDDEGCTRLPPLRYAADGSSMDDDARKRLDYDDVDPVDVGLGRIAFVSSRLPDLGRGHSRRATQLWALSADSATPRPVTANRNNDRWPWLTHGEELMLFSTWSRNREVIGADGELRPEETLVDSSPPLTRPTDAWNGMHVKHTGDQFGYAAKLHIPIWRPRSLYNGKMAFATTRDGKPTIAQVELGALQVGGSSLARDSEFPRQQECDPVFAPTRDADGRTLAAGCPSPCPGGMVLFAAAPEGTQPGGYGLYLLPQEWRDAMRAELLFDDPALVDAEPVAVCVRPVVVSPSEPPTDSYPAPAKLDLIGGRVHTGATGRLHNPNVNTKIIDPYPGYRTDTGNVLVGHPTGVKAVAVYGAHRDRFDDPVRPRVPGGWEKLLVSPVDRMGMSARVPADPLLPTVIAGVDDTGKVVSWTGGTDSAGRAGRFFAVAGDHYSGTRAKGYHFCIGCHTGHTFIPADIAER